MTRATHRSQRRGAPGAGSFGSKKVKANVMYRLPSLDGAAHLPDGPSRSGAKSSGCTCPHAVGAVSPQESSWTRYAMFATSVAVLMMLYFSGVEFFTALGWAAAGTASLLSICGGLPRIPGLIGRYKVSRRPSPANPVTVPDQGRS